MRTTPRASRCVPTARWHGRTPTCVLCPFWSQAMLRARQHPATCSHSADDRTFRDWRNGLGAQARRMPPRPHAMHRVRSALRATACPSASPGSCRLSWALGRTCSPAQEARAAARGCWRAAGCDMPIRRAARSGTSRATLSRFRAARRAAMRRRHAPPRRRRRCRPS